MTWFLAAVAVLVLGAAFVVGSGRWGSMPELVDDRPAHLPGPGAIGPDDLRETEFSVVARGYSMQQVDALLERLASQLERRPGSPLLEAGELADDTGTGVAPTA